MDNRRVRFTLVQKMIVSFFVIVMVMGAGGLLVLQPLKSLFKSNQTEFRSVAFLQGLESSISAEQKTADALFARRDTLRMRLFAIFNRQFDDYSDSLRRLADDERAKRSIDTIRSFHQGYINLVQRSVSALVHDHQYDSTAFRAEESRIMGDLTARIDRISHDQIPALSKALENFQAERDQTADTAIKIIIITLVISSALAIIFVKALIKPLKPLQAGTEKVGEGKYETVAITTNDEIADLTVAFNLMSEKLRQLDEMRMALMSEISHEMRTPLQVIKAGCYTIMHAKSGPPLNEYQRDSIAMIHQATNRINSFVNSFLDIAKMEAGLMKYNFVPFSLNELLSPLVQEVQLIAQTRKITLTYEAAELPPIMLDKERISQVFSNLLSNALKYTPENGTISVRLVNSTGPGPANRNGNGFVHVEVQDSGVGIPEGDLAKLFDKFYQAKNVPLVNEKGSGLGLALVKHVTEAHGGTVSVRSTVGAGSTFVVDLPI